ncbi:hypothetical protein N7522_003620 [Penicillium canescens]|nr:hypothetical protein N7522_003620 [Penicillium canescens]
MADMTSLDNRGVWSTLFDSHTTIHTLYLGTIVAQRILDYTTWRCGWASVSETLSRKPSDTWDTKIYRLLSIQFDLPEAVLLMAGLSLLLIPLSLTGSNNSSAWTHGLLLRYRSLGWSS